MHTYVPEKAWHVYMCVRSHTDMHAYQQFRHGISGQTVLAPAAISSASSDKPEWGLNSQPAIFAAGIFA